MKQLLTNIRGVVSRIGQEFRYLRHKKPYPDLEDEFMDINRACRPHTVTSLERMYAPYKATEYVLHNQITGDIVERGVYRGGSSMVSALALRRGGTQNNRSTCTTPTKG